MNTQALVTEFVAYLRSRGMRMTPERRHILQHIFSAHTHFEVDDLHVRLRDAGHRISKATVYRTVALLADCGILRSSIAPSGSASEYYELVYGLETPHEHLQCQECGRVFEVADPVLLGHLRRIAVTMGYELVDHSVKIVGRCVELENKGVCSKSGFQRPPDKPQ
ncbi:MAG TPA: transcriptional repressor [Candidatus Latescibacteria bacterium]|nr:transcriptional repressor [Candidatus Latescibacterota bacterium]